MCRCHRTPRCFLRCKLKSPQLDPSNGDSWRRVGALCRGHQEIRCGNAVPRSIQMGVLHSGENKIRLPDNRRKTVVCVRQAMQEPQFLRGGEGCVCAGALTDSAVGQASIVRTNRIPAKSVPEGYATHTHTHSLSLARSLARSVEHVHIHIRFNSLIRI